MNNDELMNVPYSESGKKLLSYVTNGFYDKSYIAKWIYQVIGNEFDTAKYSIEDIVNQFFIETATWGLAYHEEKWGLPINENLSFELRRELIKKKKNEREPKTPFMLENYIRNITKCRCYISDINDNPLNKVFEHPNLFYLILMCDDTRDIDLKRIRKILNEQKQSHTDYIINQRLPFLIFNEEHINLEHLIIKTLFDTKNVFNIKSKQYIRFVFGFDYFSHFKDEDKMYTWYFDGKSLLNGSKNLDAHLINMDSRFKNRYKFIIRNKETINENSNKSVLNFSFKNNNPAKTINVIAKIEVGIRSDKERFNYDYKEKRKTWRLNGEFKLDGKRKLNSIYKEDKNGF